MLIHKRKRGYGGGVTMGLGACPGNPGLRREHRVIEHRGDNPVVGWRHRINHRIIIRCSTTSPRRWRTWQGG